MKKLTLLIFTICAMAMGAQAQKFNDVIKLKTGETIPCRIESVDTMLMLVKYHDTKVMSLRKTEFSKIEYFEMNGQRNAGLDLQHFSSDLFKAKTTAPATVLQKGNDVVNLRNGEVIKCTIQRVDTVANTIWFVDNRTLTQQEYYLNGVGSYEWNGVVNAGIDGIAASTIENTAVINTRVETSMNANALSGEQLIKFANMAQTGIAIMIAGTVISSTALLSKDVDMIKVLGYTGLVVSTTGFIIHLASYSNARKAGELMKFNNNVSLNVNDAGLGLALRIK